MDAIRLFIHKLRHWEYWPFEIVHFPVFFYWLYLSARARSFFFFSAANPGIETGGMLGESKYKILKKIPEQYCTPTKCFIYPFQTSQVLQNLNSENWNFPLIFKPDVGERGSRVEKIKNKQEAIEYLDACSYDVLVQPFIDYPVELGIFYYRRPSQHRGQVISVVEKKFLSIEGDGHSTMQELIRSNMRALFQHDRLYKKYKHQWNETLEKGQRVLLEPIGNHCRGTSFINANHIIDEQLTDVFDHISKSVEGFYFGRFDLKCSSIEELKQGKFISILELNGAGSEQGHIYHPGFSFFKAIKSILQQWKLLFDISVENHRRGTPYMSWREAKAYLHKSKALRLKYKL